MQIVRTGTYSAVFTVGALLLGQASAIAQEGPTDATASAIEEIVVTAQRRLESMQDVPISITAYSGEQLSISGIETTMDLPVVTPGLTMTMLRNAATPYIRGVGTQSGTTESAVAFYVDDVYMASPAGRIFALNNIERVEVLKGPQGTLFGRNATGGLIHVITRDPSHTPELRISAGYGSYDTWTGSLYGTAGLTERIAADISLYNSHQSDGWGRNLILGNDVNLRQDWMARSKVKFDVTDATTVIISGDYASWESDIGNARQLIAGAIGVGGITQIGTIYDVNSSIPFEDAMGDMSSQYGVSVKVDHQFSDSLNLASTTAYRDFDIRSATDSDTIPPEIVHGRFTEVTETIQQEFLLNGSNNSLEWTAGAFMFLRENGAAPLTITGAPPSTSRFIDIDFNSYSVFGQGTYRLLEDTSLTLGLRYTWEDAEVQGTYLAAPGHPLPVGTVTFTTDSLSASQTEREWNEPTWHLALDHRLSDNLMAYASYSRGFKSGAFNSNDANAVEGQGGAAVDPEILDAYEVGFKSDLFNGLMRFNAAAFYYDYEDIQLTTVIIATINSNAAQGEILGAEAEIVASPPVAAGDLQIRGSLSVLDTEYVEYPDAPINIPNDPSMGGNISIVGDASGNSMIRAPEFSSSLILDYRVPVANDLTGGANITWQHMGEFYWDVDNRLTQDSYNVVNAELSLGRLDDRWRVKLWARNLTDTKYFNLVNTTGFSDAGGPAAPRTYGITVDVGFGG